METRLPRNTLNNVSTRQPEPLGSPLGPPTPTLAAQLSYMLQQPDIQPSPSPLFQQQSHVHFQPQTPRSAFQPPTQLQTPGSTPQSPTPRSILTLQTPRSVHFQLPPQPQTPRSVLDPDPPRQLRQTNQKCTRCRNVSCIPPSTSFITTTTSFRPVAMDRSTPRCIACDLTRTKELCKDIISPAPSYIDPVQKIEQDIMKMENYLKEGVQVEEMKRGIVEGRRRLEATRRLKRERLEMVWERFYGAWGPGLEVRMQRARRGKSNDVRGELME